MPFTKNDKNINTQGRKKGVPNKTTAEVKTLLLNVFENNLSEIDKQQDKLTLNERITLNRTLLAYVLPTINTNKQVNLSNCHYSPILVRKIWSKNKNLLTLKTYLE